MWLPQLWLPQLILDTTKRTLEMGLKPILYFHPSVMCLYLFSLLSLLSWLTLERARGGGKIFVRGSVVKNKFRNSWKDREEAVSLIRPLSPLSFPIPPTILLPPENVPRQNSWKRLSACSSKPSYFWLIGGENVRQPLSKDTKSCLFGINKPQTHTDKKMCTHNEASGFSMIL